MKDDNDDSGLVDDSTRRTVLKTGAAAGIGMLSVGASTGSAAASSGPTAVINADSLPAEQGDEITFDASESSAPAGIQSYEWYVRNNETQDDFLSSPWKTGTTFTESFADSPFSLKLVVTDNDGNTDSTRLDFIAHQTVTPTARITRLPEAPDNSGPITFSGRLSAAPRGTIESYEWYVRNHEHQDDYLSSPWKTGPTLVEQFADDNTFSLKLVVTDSHGNTSATETTFTV
ncbi:PKD domain-containing protein [Haloferax larsenii]|uniref:PKD domain-containing protein n=1 Tax=Haloferax larsenii TaxID=302484 RepID=A0ABY5REM3_HALLR|nr:PKD domain-containing protein [Haloferax larsenii]UVE49625.1 PKD domain-containing protein [Haloferax larsenii]